MRIGVLAKASKDELDWAKTLGFGSIQWVRFADTEVCNGSDWRGLADEVVGMAAERHPEAIKAMVADGHEICSHGYRWEEVFRLSEAEEREHIRLAIESFERTCGKRPVGWYCRYGASVHTRRLVAEEGGFLYDSDAYNDDVPYFVEVEGKQHLVVPYTSDVNDFRYWNSPGLSQASDFLEYMQESFDVLYEEAADGFEALLGKVEWPEASFNAGWARYVLLEAYAHDVLLHQADLIWTEAEGYRAPALGELPSASEPAAPATDPFAQDPFAEDPFGGDPADADTDPQETP